MSLLGVFKELIEHAIETRNLTESEANNVIEMLGKYLKDAATLKKMPEAVPVLSLLLPDKSVLIKEELKEWNQATDELRWEAYLSFIENFIPEMKRADVIYIWLSHDCPLSISELIKALDYIAHDGEAFAYKLLALWSSSDKNAVDAEKIIGPLIQSLESGKPTICEGSNEIQRLQALPQTDQQKAIVIACWWLSPSNTKNREIPLEKIYPLIKNVNVPPLTENEDLAWNVLAKWLRSLDGSVKSIETVISFIRKADKENESDTELNIVKVMIIWWDYFKPEVSAFVQVLVALSDSEKIRTIRRLFESNPGKTHLSILLELINTINDKREKAALTLDYLLQEMNTITTTEGMQVLKTLEDFAKGILISRWFKSNPGKTNLSTFLELINTINDKREKAALTLDYLLQEMNTITTTEGMQALQTLEDSAKDTLIRRWFENNQDNANVSTFLELIDTIKNETVKEKVTLAYLGQEFAQPNQNKMNKEQAAAIIAALGREEKNIFSFINTYLKQYNEAERALLLLDIISNGWIHVNVTLMEIDAFLVRVGVTVEDFFKAISPEMSQSMLEIMLRDKVGFNDLIGMALELKNKELLMLILSKFSLSTLKTQRFRVHCDKIAEIFPENTENQDLYQLLDEAAVKSIHDKFDKLGMIDDNDMALILAAKTAKKRATDPDYENSIFVIKNDEIEQLIEQIKFLITNNTNDIVEFQIIRYSGVHAMVGGFEINKTQTQTPPIIRYIHCESVESTSSTFTKVDAIITEKFKTEIFPLIEQIEIYNPSTPTQKGQGCTYFSLDSASMLATPEVRPYTHNVMQYMRDHKEANTQKMGEKMTQISAPLPPRFIRGSQYIEHLTPLWESPEANVLVNKKNKTALQSIQEHLDMGIGKTLNMRVIHKMKTYHHKVKEFIHGKKLSSSEISKLEAPYRIDGLQQFCKRKITNTKRFITPSYNGQISQSTDDNSKNIQKNPGLK